MANKISQVVNLVSKQAIQALQNVQELQLKSQPIHNQYIEIFEIETHQKKIKQKLLKTPPKKGLAEMSQLMKPSSVRNTGDFNISDQKSFVHQMQLLRPEINTNNNVFIDELTTIQSENDSDSSYSF